MSRHAGASSAPPRINSPGRLTQRTQRHRGHREEERRSKREAEGCCRGPRVARTGGTPVSQVVASVTVTRASRPCWRRRSSIHPASVSASPFLFPPLLLSVFSVPLCALCKSSQERDPDPPSPTLPPEYGGEGARTFVSLPVARPRRFGLPAERLPHPRDRVGGGVAGALFTSALEEIVREPAVGA